MATKLEKKQPKDGKHFVALLAGGNESFYSALRLLLARIGVEIRYSWGPDDADPAPITQREPSPDVDIAIILRDAGIPRSPREHLAWRLKKKVPFVCQPLASTKGIGEEIARAGFFGPPITLPPPVVTAPSAPAAAPPAATTPAPKPIEEPAPAVAEAPVAAETPKVPATTAQAARMLRKAREALGVTQKELGKLVAPTVVYFHTTLSSLETGTGEAISTPVLEAIELAYGIPVGTIPRTSTRGNNRYDLAAARERIQKWYAERTAPAAATTSTPEPEPEPAPAPVAPVAPAPPAAPEPERVAAPPPVSTPQPAPVTVTPEPSPLSIAPPPEPTVIVASFLQHAPRNGLRNKIALLVNCAVEQLMTVDEATSKICDLTTAR